MAYEANTTHVIILRFGHILCVIVSLNPIQPGSLIKEKNLFFKQSYFAKEVTKIPKLGHYLKIFWGT